MSQRTSKTQPAKHTSSMVFYLRFPKFLLSLICAFIPGKAKRKRFREKFSPQNCFVNSSVHGKIYFPYYSSPIRYPHKIPEVYNADGNKVDFFFLRDKHMGSFGDGKYFIWDRFNVGLDTHFYSHEAMTRTMGSPSRCYGMLVESEAITPDGYALLRNTGIARDFTNILTFSEDLLNRLPNARFIPAGTVWIGRDGLSEMCDSTWENKHELVSILASKMNTTPFHRLRIALAKRCKRLNLAKTFGAFDGGPRIASVSEALKDFRYSIVVENFSDPYYFTEKLLNCFASMTVPVYIGASKVGEFFNTDGIIQVPESEIADLESGGLEKLLRRENISEQDYLNRLPAVIDNFKRAQHFLSLEDYIYEHCLDKKNAPQQ